uniref:CD97 antigen-like n=1 Tax=Phallusia mammillata TaxID=59560 RepID=A0A6F9D8Z6_9ASCI|nr:CD97 antigen-like [Phallusia mammillata]
MEVPSSPNPSLTMNLPLSKTFNKNVEIRISVACLPYHTFVPEVTKICDSSLSVRVTRTDSNSGWKKSFPLHVEVFPGPAALNNKTTTVVPSAKVPDVLQRGLFNVGPSASNVKSLSIKFPHCLNSSASIKLQLVGAPLKTFDMLITAITDTGFNVTVVRTDQVAGWSDSPILQWRAINDSKLNSISATPTTPQGPTVKQVGWFVVKDNKKSSQKVAVPLIPHSNKATVKLSWKQPPGHIFQVNVDKILPTSFDSIVNRIDKVSGWNASFIVQFELQEPAPVALTATSPTVLQKGLTNVTGSTTPVQTLTIPFNTAIKFRNQTVTATLSGGKPATFKINVTNITDCCFTVRIERTDKKAGHNSTLTIDWKLVNQTTTPLVTTVAPVTLTSATTSSLKPTPAITVTASAVIKTIYCPKTAILVGGTTYNFAQTEVGISATSAETCKDGRPIATSQCVRQTSSVAKFQSTTVVVCNASLNQLFNKVPATNATTQEVQAQMAELKLLLSTPVNQTLAENATAYLEALINTNPTTVQIAPSTLFDAIVSSDKISTALGNTTTAKTSKQKLKTGLRKLTDRVVMPANQNFISLKTNKTSVQVTDVQLDANNKYKDVNSTLVNPQTGQQVVIVRIAGKEIDQAAKARVKRALSTTGTVRMSFWILLDPGLFPPAGTSQFIVSTSVTTGNKTTSNIPVTIIYLTNREKQSAVLFPNTTLKEYVTRTQCKSYKTALGQWTAQDCSYVLNSFPQMCICKQVTDYSLVVEHRIMDAPFVLTGPSYFGFIICIIALAITFLCFLLITKLREHPSAVYVCNICVILFICNVAFIAGIDEIYTGTSEVFIRTTCYASGIFMQYFFLVAWFWLVANIYHASEAMLNIEGAKSPALIAALCYIVPFFIVLITAFVAISFDNGFYRPDDIFFVSTYVARHMCWIHGSSFSVGFILPVMLSLVLVIILVALVLARLLCCKRPKPEQPQKHPHGHAKLDFVFSVLLLFGFAIAWVFGFVMLHATNQSQLDGCAWMFGLLNGIMGVVMFLVYCFFPAVIRAMLIAFVCCKKKDEMKKGKEKEEESEQGVVEESREHVSEERPGAKA